MALFATGSPRTLRAADPQGVRRLLRDGHYGGTLQRPDEDVMRVWRVGVEELRRVIADGWSDG